MQSVERRPFGKTATYILAQTGTDGVKFADYISDGVNDNVKIQEAIDAINALGGGSLYLRAATYNMASSRRTDTGVSYSAGTWSDSSITADDVGSYILGENIDDQRVPKITSVNPGTSFTTDVAPAGTVSSQSIEVISPALIIPPSVKLIGEGITVSKLLDSGSGVTILTIGGDSSNRVYHYGLSDLAIYGDNNSTMYGIYIANFAWFFTIDRCDISYHGVAGLAADGNINSNSVLDTIFNDNGDLSSSTYTGAVFTHPYYVAASSSFNFINCFFKGSMGWGMVSPQTIGCGGVGLINCQFNNTQASSATGSGTSLALTDHANGLDAKSFVIGGWSETAELYDVDSYGYPTIINFTLASAVVTSHLRATGGVTQIIGCRFENLSGASITFGSGGQITWNGASFNDSYAYSGCGFSNGATPPIGYSGSTEGIQVGSGNVLRMGSGAPDSGLGIQGDIYLRTDGGSGTTFYLKTDSSTWTGRA